MPASAIVIWCVWAVLVLFAAVLYIYRSSLTRDEEDQIFLDDSFNQERAAQAVIVSKVARVEPMLKLARWLVVAMTVVVAAYYVVDMVRQFQ